MKKLILILTINLFSSYVGICQTNIAEWVTEKDTLKSSITETYKMNYLRSVCTKNRGGIDKNGQDINLSDTTLKKGNYIFILSYSKDTTLNIGDKLFNIRIIQDGKSTDYCVIKGLVQNHSHFVARNSLSYNIETCSNRNSKVHKGMTGNEQSAFLEKKQESIYSFSVLPEGYIFLHHRDNFAIYDNIYFYSTKSQNDIYKAIQKL